MSAWLFFALLAPALFGLANILDKALTKRFSTVAVNVFAGLFTGLVVLALPFFRLDLPFVAISLALAAGALWFLAGFPYFKAISIEEVSRVVPLWQLTVPMALVFSLVFLGEKLDAKGYAAVALIFCGAFLVSVKDLRKTLRLTPAFWLMVLAAAFVTASSLLTKRLYAFSGFWAAQVLLFLGNFVAAVAAFALFGKLRASCVSEVRKSSPRLKALLLFRMCVEILGYVTLNLALLTGPVSLTTALDGLSVFFVFIAATLISLWWPAFFREELDRKTLLMKAAAIVMIFAGLALVR